METGLGGQRWDDYVLRRGDDFFLFWKELLSSSTRDLLFVVGQGFDPRMKVGVEAILNSGGNGRRNCVVIQFDEGAISPSRLHDALLKENFDGLQSHFTKAGEFITKRVQMWSKDGRRRTGSRNVASVFESPADLAGYTDVVVDISAMPRTLYMPLIAKLLHLVDHWNFDSKVPNIHVVVSDDPDFDQSITGQGLDEDASYIHGFESGIQLEATANIPRVWMPILGEGKVSHFERIYDLVNPDEVAPILPFPCLRPRRTDDLFVEYRSHLMDRLRIEPRNFLFVPEQNPFGVYRQVTTAVKHYSDALQPLGGCKVILSALSSKLISLGCLLAAYELKRMDLTVGIAHVHSTGYRMAGTMPDRVSLFEAWLSGDCYEKEKD
ncbi:MAG: hypothetical protein Q7R50_08670 [Dehalococcoidales bacterium]|nr:hypothetical protein [Dehalococcoidales bacterium]